MKMKDVSFNFTLAVEEAFDEWAGRPAAETEICRIYKNGSNFDGYVHEKS
jgi:hypothetical protein